MIKKKSTAQNIVIVILCIMLLTSIGFGVTYSYYNGKTNLVKGTITTANLSIQLYGTDEYGQTTEFSISAPFGEEFLVPGNSLNNVELNLFNKCNQETFMVVVYSLSAIKNDATRLDVTNQLTNMPAISFQDGVIDTSVWRHIEYKCENIDATFTCLVGINPFPPKGPTNGTYINVLKPNSIKIPTEWNDVLQNCSVTISVTAYAIQAEGLDTEYNDPIMQAQEKYNVNTNPEIKRQALNEKAQAIASAVLQICNVDVSVDVDDL